MEFFFFSVFTVLLGVSLVSTGHPENYPSNADVYEVFIFGGTYSQGDAYSQILDKVCNFLYDSTPVNGTELLVTSGEANIAVWALSQCNSHDRDHCKDCLIASRVHIDNYNASSPVRGGGYWTNGSQFNCFLLYNSQPLQISDQDNVLIMTIPVSAPSANRAPNSATAMQPTVTLTSMKTKKVYKTATFLEAAAIVVILLLSIVVCVCIHMQKKKFQRPIDKFDEGGVETIAYGGVETFAYETLRMATGGFSERNRLGSGGFGVVYKGTLPSGTEVAVKQLTNLSERGIREFENEVKILTGIQHKNLVRFKGYCIEHRLLVYEYVEKRSLDLALFDPAEGCFLNWTKRYNIILGIARGLEYLHQNSPIQILHRDIKASNILLDSQYGPKICDFGISRLFAASKDFTTTKVMGTLGYVAPEVFRTGMLTVKADIYSFGVLTLEIVAGRKCNDHTMRTERQLLLPWAWYSYQKQRMLDLVDLRLDSTYSVKDVLKVIHVALLCTVDDPQSRPAMSDVVAMLLDYVDLVPLPPQPPNHVADTASYKFRARPGNSAESFSESSDSAY